MLSVLVTQLKSWPEIFREFEFWFETISESPAYTDFVERHGLPSNFFRFAPRRLGSPYDIQANSDDVLIDIGGIAYPDGAAVGNLRNFRRHRYFASRGTRSIFFTQDFGPAEKLFTRWLAKLAITGADAIFARSEQSKEFLSLIAPSAQILGPYPDCTFALEPARLPDPFASKRYAVVVPSAIMWNKYGEHYLDTLLEITQAVPDDLAVLLMVHNFTANGNVSDRLVCDLVADRLRALRKVEIHSANSTPAELKAILCGAEAVISSRYHALVGALTSDTPAFAIGWSHKYSEFLKLYDLGEWSLNLAEVPKNKAELRTFASNVICEIFSEEKAENLVAINRDLKTRVDASFSKLRILLNK